MRNLLLGGGLMLSAVSAFFLFQDPDTPAVETHSKPTESAAVTVPPIEPAKLEIASSPKRPDERPEIEEPIKASPKKRIADVHEKYVTYDRTKQYRIALVDPDTEERGHGPRYPFKGVINGHGFTIRIPRSMLNDSLRLRFQDMKSKEIKEVDIPFATDLQSLSHPPKISFDADDPTNYEITYVDAKTHPFP